MPLDPVDTLRRLVRTPSVNPMGREVAGPPYGEGRMTSLLEEICREQGWPFLRQRVHEGRFNLLVFIEGYPSAQGGGELILWDAHQDTVSADGMTVDPFGGEVRDGRVYGRGASDVKGSMAAMIAALSRLPNSVERNSKPRPSIVLACTANEECGFTGAKAVANSLPAATQASSACQGLETFFPRRPDAAIVAEPTHFNVIVAHQGVVRWRCHTLGRAAHSSRPDAGVNAIYRMARVVRAIERFQENLRATSAEHPLCGRPSVCVSTIRGGVGINTVPDRAMIEIDRRLGPSERPDSACAELAEYIKTHADVGGCEVTHDPPFMQSPGLVDAINRPLAERVVRLVREHDRPSELTGVPFGTDAAAIAAAGVPTVVFGPGSIDQAHTQDEFIEITELRLATDIFHAIASRGLKRGFSG
jgi:acetylornithine deacetylase